MSVGGKRYNNTDIFNSQEAVAQTPGALHTTLIPVYTSSSSTILDWSCLCWPDASRWAFHVGSSTVALFDPCEWSEDGNSTSFKGRAKIWNQERKKEWYVETNQSAHISLAQSSAHHHTRSTSTWCEHCSYLKVRIIQKLVFVIRGLYSSLFPVKPL